MFDRKSIAVGSSGSASAKQGQKKPEGDAATIDAALVVFGRDDKNKAHASRFGKDDVDAAIKAAHLMGFIAVTVTHVTIRSIAIELPEGRLFDSGKGFVPFVKEGVCLALEAHIKQFPDDVRQLSTADIEALDKAGANASGDAEENGDGDNAAVDDDASDVGSGSSSANDSTSIRKLLPAEAWFDIPVGMHVLAIDEPNDGWWEAEVTKVHKSGMGDNIISMLTLKWIGWPDQVQAVRRSNEVALFHPAYNQSKPTGETA